MELKSNKDIFASEQTITFNRTAYGIEIAYQDSGLSPVSTFNRTAYGIETP